MNYKLTFFALLAALFVADTSDAQVVGSDDFDGGGMFMSRTFTPDLLGNPIPGTFTTSNFDVFGIVDRFVNFEIPDDTLINPDFGGLVPSTKTDNFFCVLDLLNDENMDGTGTLVYEFDVSGATNLEFSADFGARGDFEDTDFIIVTASIDGGTPQVLIELLADEEDVHIYAYEDGVTTEELADPMKIDGVIVDNNIANFSAPISGTGSVLTLTFDCSNNGGDETMVVDNLEITGDEGKGGMLGDVNCDGVVNLLDVAPFVDLVSLGEFSAKADINGDGDVDLLDVAPFVALLAG